MKAFSSDSVLSKWKDFISHLVSRYGAVRIEEDEMFMVEFWFQENRKVPRGFSDGDFVKNVYVSLDDFMEWYHEYCKEGRNFGSIGPADESLISPYFSGVKER